MSASRLLARSFRTLAYGRRHVSSAATDAPGAPIAAVAESHMETILGTRVDPTSVPENVARAMSLENAGRAEVRRVRKMRLIERFKRSESDTGSPEVQSALVAKRDFGSVRSDVNAREN